jgi:hypothetical protein
LDEYVTFGGNYVVDVYVPKYYIAFDQYVVENWDYVMFKLGGTMPFVRARWAREYSIPGVIPIRLKEIDYPSSVSRTGNVVTQSLKLAYWMGFTKAYLVGCDWGEPRLHHREMLPYEEIEKNRPPQPAAMPRHIEELELANKEWNRAGREIFNLSPNTQMPVIPTRPLSLLKEE